MTVLRDFAASFVVAAFAPAAVLGCSGTRSLVAEDGFPTRIVSSSPCTDTRPPIDIRAQRIAEDLGHKPSRDVKRYLVDLHVHRSDQLNLWLLVDEDTFPLVVDSVWREKGSRDAEEQARANPRPWWFSGNGAIQAWPLGRASDVSLTNIEVGTGASRVSVTLGVLELDGASPQEWLIGGRPQARGVFVPRCRTWIDLSTLSQDSGPE